jgi:hypothetical protein
MAITTKQQKSANEASKQEKLKWESTDTNKYQKASTICVPLSHWGLQ